MIVKEDLLIRDPFILVEQHTYYVYAALCIHEKPSFVCYRSQDLQLFEEPLVIFSGDETFWATEDYWAPEVHKYKNKYYLFATLKSPYHCRATQIFVSDTPDGTFVPLTQGPITPSHWECLDGTLFIDRQVPYLIFCREWLQVKDGEMYIARLSDDLKEMVEQPKRIFSASEAKWPVSFQGEGNYITDGPFLFRVQETIFMIWSSFAKDGYAVGLCESQSLYGPWIHHPSPIYHENGGHAMIFESKGQRYMTLHAPNSPNGKERMMVVPFSLPTRLHIKNQVL